MKNFFLIVVLALLAFTSNVKANVYAPELTEVVPLIYSGQVSAAKKKIQAYIDQNPEEAQGYLLLGIAKEWEMIVRNRNSSFHHVIMKDLQKARVLGKKALEKDASIRNKIILGNTYLYISKKLIDTSHSGQAGSNLKIGKNLMEEVMKKDPNNPHAYFAIGLFNYFADNVPSGFKWLAKILGFDGSRSKGLSYLNKASQVQNLTQMDATFMLTYIYSQKEGNYPKALETASQAYKKYPSNLLFLFDYAEMAFRNKKIDLARSHFEKYFKLCSKLKKGCPQKYDYLSNYFMAWSYIDDKNYEAARPYVEKADKLDTKVYKDRSSDIQKWRKIVGI